MDLAEEKTVWLDESHFLGMVTYREGEGEG